MKPHTSESLQKLPTALLEPEQYVRRHDLLKLLVDLSKNTGVHIRVKRVDRLNYGNFSTVVRASGALIMVRELNSGPAEVIPDLRDVQHFELDKEFLNYRTGTIYGVV